MGASVIAMTDAVARCRRGPTPSRCDARQFVDEGPSRRVMLDAFWIDRREVSNQAYEQCVAAGVCTMTGHQAARRWNRNPSHPVTLISWYQAKRYCTWMGRRLPTEAEWERAARGLSGRRFPWGKWFHPRLANHGRDALNMLDARDGFLELAPVDAFLDGQSPEGVMNMAGNVEEWVQDWYLPRYPPSNETNPSGPASGQLKVVRGGSFIHGPVHLRTTSRHRDVPLATRAWRGFRCARSARRLSANQTTQP